MSDIVSRLQRSSLDTSIVLFVFMVDFGMVTMRSGVVEGLILSPVLVALLVAPYFLPFDGDRPDLMVWLGGRTVIAIVGLAAGIGLAGAIGNVLPEVFRFVPLTLLICTAALSCLLQGCAIIRFRLAR